MDFKKIFIKNACPTKVGGQAVLEGIMMKGEDRTAVVIRKPNGKLHIKTEMLKKPGKLRKIPILRGVFVFVDALVTGTRTLLYSAEVLEDSEGGEAFEKDKLTLWLEKKYGEKGALNAMLYVSVFLAILFTVGIFIIGPTAVVSVMKYVTQNEVALNLIEGIFRILVFVLYILLISKMKDIQTVFQFHGAEHKCIHCYENGLPLTPENCKPFKTLHPRCGTSFLMFVMVISLLLFSLLGWPNLFWRIASRLLLIPVIAGLSYELLRWAGRSDSVIVKFLSVPGLLLQKLTTKEPEERQLEVAIAAMKAVLVSPETPTYEGECDREGNLVPTVPKEAESDELEQEQE
ncbi:DUF1385 domain-containing protein [Sinanaerobacter chloroacetimidivorans]|uniref:DUF1385 domain-containing protein n=1 Tax=Sinanaerobacter chloroacetimidivorans TaxID=2818044 RepID=A0A8J7W582_9FIRM|nr:DUF1385 domain-containing protein [Sinanaerobacter chloroacetimidivorans]MBR0599578.1 DUF1385 domain-containing protein [Sinanaerobacter chloroacetimidivorans]